MRIACVLDPDPAFIRESLKVLETIPVGSR